MNIGTLQRVCITRYRTGSHNLKIESGRTPHIPRDERYCSCNTSLQTIKHVLLECQSWWWDFLRFFREFYVLEWQRIFDLFAPWLANILSVYMYVVVPNFLYIVWIFVNISCLVVFQEMGRRKMDKSFPNKPGNQHVVRVTWLIRENQIRFPESGSVEERVKQLRWPLVYEFQIWETCFYQNRYVKIYQISVTVLSPLF